MNIVFLIGNGFDISLGLKTSYRDFAKYYVQEPSFHPSIEKLKKEIEKSLKEENKDDNKWSDFELAFGEYTKKLSGEQEFDIVYDDILMMLQAYLLEEKKRFDKDSQRYSLNVKKISNSLIYPDSFLREERQFSRLFQKADSININIINFNYTTTIDDFIKVIRGPYLTRIRSVVKVGNVHHIHGTLDKTMLFGVNDPSQIANTAFQNSSIISSELAKPNFNQRLGYGVDEICAELINNADLICVYGMSIGDTDKCWWENICESLKNVNHHAILFHWSEKRFSPIQERLQIREEERVKANFLKKVGLDFDSYISRRIFIGYNTAIFQNIWEEGKVTK